MISAIVSATFVASRFFRSSIPRLTSVTGIWWETIWLGLTRVGGIVALVNTNLTGDALAHSINIVAPKHIIVARDLCDRAIELGLPAEKVQTMYEGTDCDLFTPGNRQTARRALGLPPDTRSETTTYLVI